jgi:hypothetical protein
MDYSGFQASRYNMYSNHFKVWVEFQASKFSTIRSVAHQVKRRQLPFLYRWLHGRHPDTGEKCIYLEPI